MTAGAWLLALLLMVAGIIGASAIWNSFGTLLIAIPALVLTLRLLASQLARAYDARRSTDAVSEPREGWASLRCQVCGHKSQKQGHWADVAPMPAHHVLTPGGHTQSERCVGSYLPVAVQRGSGGPVVDANFVFGLLCLPAVLLIYLIR